jgi:negative regulator of flagellin synthesis FlgM
MVNPIDNVKANQELVTRGRNGIRDTANQAAGTPGSPPDEGSSTDQVSLTHAALRLQRLEQRLAEEPVVDEKRVETIRHALDKGIYEINPEHIADKLLAFERNFGNT